MAATEIFESRESAVRSYCLTWPEVFDRASGSWLYGEDGRPYLDFFAGAGVLNYGHNHPILKKALLEYLSADRVIHSLDMYTAAKREFLMAVEEVVLHPRNLDYRVQFPGPAGANAVEAALKLARKTTRRTQVVAFTGSFHGMTLGALSVTSNEFYRAGAGLPLKNTVFLPFGQVREGDESPSAWFGRLLHGHGTRLDEVAAVIVETVQGEGGINVALPEWLSELEGLCRQWGMLLIVDDVQMGCGRTGPFFSFETAAIRPDIVCLSKSISGYGLPMALTLIRPELDIWKPGEHNGTFRGIGPAFITGAAALRTFWCDDQLERATLAMGSHVLARLTELAHSLPGAAIEARGSGLACAMSFADGEFARKVAEAAFQRGLLVETAGCQGEVIKLLPPLTASQGEIDQGLSLLSDAAHSVF